MLRLMVVCLLAVLFGRTEGYFRRVCEHQAMSINCGSKLINIRSASYGRTQQGLCGSNGNTNCHAGSSMTVARHECQGQKRCTLYVKNSAFGDPCPGTVKYLTVIYDCVWTSSEALLLRVCENHSNAIHCHMGKINILSANYGRLTGKQICGGPVRTTNCGAAGSRDKVIRDCQGKEYCVLQATNGQFGDPCRGTRKYLEVRYKCE
ncbi:L-rhamnose-binding lectin CSL3-like [Oculina patagonica]